jgi:catechol 2,3-dioxygenase-like lactoylglutathione lyase family enzyme
MASKEDRTTKLAADRGRVTPVQLAHIVRRTSRFEAMLEWYQVVLGAEIVHADGMLAFLTYDDEHHRIAIARIPGLEDQPPVASRRDGWTRGARAACSLPATPRTRCRRSPARACARGCVTS